MAVRNFTDYFREERDVYVQNISNAQLSLEFNLGEGRVEGFTVPPNRDPINLTQSLPFAAIKNSMDFRKMLSRRPPVLTLLSQKEYEAYFAKRAKARNMLIDGKPDIEAAIDAAEEKRRRTSDKNLRETIADKVPEPIHEVIERGTGPGGATRFGERERVAHSEFVSEDEVINPRVLHLCNQVKAELEDHERMPSAELLEALQELPTLTLHDLEHIRAHGFYRAVKKWAKMSTARVIQEQEEAEDTSEDTSEDEEAAPAAV